MFSKLCSGSVPDWILVGCDLIIKGFLDVIIYFWGKESKLENWLISPSSIAENSSPTSYFTSGLSSWNCLKCQFGIQFKSRFQSSLHYSRCQFGILPPYAGAKGNPGIVVGPSIFSCENPLHLTLEMFNLNMRFSVIIGFVTKCLNAGPRNLIPQHQRSIKSLVLPLETICSWLGSSWLHLHLYNTVLCVFHHAGNLAWNLTATDPWIWHAVSGNGWKVSVCVRSWWEGPASVSSTS